MMTVLLFNDRGWEVMTSCWSAGAKPGKSVRICYQWGADHLSWFSSATGISTVDLPIGMSEFLRAVQSGGLVDLRRFQP